MNYDRVGLSIAEYENSSEVNSFSSNYDYFLAGLVDLTEEEEWGLDLFEGKGNCSACHPSEPGSGGEPPLFTDFTFDNLGTPKNPDNPFYNMDEVFLPDGTPINPLGEGWIDKGLGGFLETFPPASFEYGQAAVNMGKHKVPTLRNVAKKPGNGFTKAYLHNGVFKTLKEVVNFYNTSGDPNAGWPPPEVPQNVNITELSNLGLTDEEEDALVAFMETLSDGYALPKSSDPIEGNFEQSVMISPNPANEKTRISYVLDHANKLQVNIYNLSGEKVDTLQEGWQAMGEHEILYATGHLPSGIYIIAIRAGQKTYVQKISIVH